MNIEVQLSFGFPTPAFTLSAADRELKRLLSHLAGRHTEVWHTTQTIAARLGVSIRAAQLRIDRLIRAGLVERIYSYGLSSRRRLRLLWREVGTAPVSADSCAESAQTPALMIEPPPHPPIGESIELAERDCGGCAANEPPPLLVVSCSEGETEELTQAAVEAMPGDRSATAWAMAKAREFTPGWVTAALRRVKVRAEFEPVRNPRGLAVCILRGFSAEGGPPLVEVETSNARKTREEREKAERIKAWEKSAEEPLPDYLLKMAAEAYA